MEHVYIYIYIKVTKSVSHKQGIVDIVSFHLWRFMAILKILRAPNHRVFDGLLLDFMVKRYEEMGGESWSLKSLASVGEKVDTNCQS